MCYVYTYTYENVQRSFSIYFTVHINDSMKIALKINGKGHSRYQRRCYLLFLSRSIHPIPKVRFIETVPLRTKDSRGMFEYIATFVESSRILRVYTIDQGGNKGKGHSRRIKCLRCRFFRWQHYRLERCSYSKQLRANRIPKVTLVITNRATNCSHVTCNNYYYLRAKQEIEEIFETFTSRVLAVDTIQGFRV